MEEGISPVIIDASTFGNDGTMTGSPTWVSGHSGLALNLSGNAQYVVVPDSNSLDIGTNNITLSAWIRPTKTAAATQYIIKKAIMGSTNGYELSLSSAGKVFVRLNQVGSADTISINSTTLYSVNNTAWMHIAATYDGTTIKLYVNGVLENSLTSSFTIGSNGTNLGIGAQADGVSPLPRV